MSVMHGLRKHVQMLNELVETPEWMARVCVCSSESAYNWTLSFITQLLVSPVHFLDQSFVGQQIVFLNKFITCG